jgi:hypothetical protein
VSEFPARRVCFGRGRVKMDWTVAEPWRGEKRAEDRGGAGVVAGPMKWAGVSAIVQAQELQPMHWAHKVSL